MYLTISKDSRLRPADTHQLAHRRVHPNLLNDCIFCIQNANRAIRRAEDPVSQARRHVAEAEVRIERQEALVARLSDNSKYAALLDQAREVLATLKYTLRLAREHLELELKK